MSRRKVPAATLLVTLALFAAACGGDGGKTPESTFKAGGIFRIQTDAFEWSSTLDPTAEYLGFAFEFFNALHRPLLGYNHKSGAKGGNTVIPDLATDLGKVTDGGKTWTFTLKSGVKFAPPLNRDVTSKDILNAFNRLANKTLSAGGYPSYYDDELVGFQDVADGKSQSVSGIETPNDKTIVFRLTRPIGDWTYRLTLAATAPMPEEVTKCFKKNGEYGRFQIASGPYMIEGTNTLNISSCAAMKPISGFDPGANGFLKLRRNPNYVASTDTKESRENFINGIDLTLNSNTNDIFERIAAGTADGESAQPPPPIILKGTTDAAFKDNFHLDPGDRTWYLFLNLAKAPFDDINVRKAVNFIMDKEGLVQARGGKPAGIVAEHILPPDVLGGKLRSGEFDPYGPNHRGDLAKAKEAMKKATKYDTNGDGLCDAKACRGVIHATRSTPPYTLMTPIIETSLAKIGIVVTTRPLAKFYATVQVPAQTPAIGSGAGWGKDYADASTFFEPLLTNAVITKEATQNFAYLGLTAAKAAEIGYKYPAGGIPSADAGIANCASKLGAERATCWADLDETVTNEMVPWVPYLWANNISVVSDAVVKYEYDQFAGEVSFVHIALDETKQRQG
jgi:peptide/nickel transport system substrate-binding protein